MAREQKIMALMVRNPQTQLHEWGGLFTQKQKLWDALLALGITPETEIFYGDGSKVKTATKDRLQDALRAVELGDKIALRKQDDPRWGIVSQVIVNETYGV